MFPHTAEAFHIVSQKANSIFFFLAEKEHTQLKGYVLHLSAKKDTLHAIEMWNVNMPPAQQAVTVGKAFSL